MHILDEALELLGTPALFEEWLKSKPAGGVVGTANRSCDCPIATFLSEKLAPRNGPKVFSSWIGVVDEHTGPIRADVQPWVRGFIHRVDFPSLTYPNRGPSAFHAVTAEAALRFLAEVK